MEEITGYSRNTIKNFKSVAERTEEIRQSSSYGDDINYTHFREVAGIPIENQKGFLQKAEAEKLSAQALREEVKQFKNTAEKVDSYWRQDDVIFDFQKIQLAHV